MATNEDFRSWLTQKLNSEREALREQQQRQFAMVEERHTQLLVEMEAKLRTDTIKASAKGSEPDLTVNNTQASAPVKQPDAYKQGPPPPLEALDPCEKQDAPSTPVGSRKSESSSKPARRESSYKNQALKNLAGQGSHFATADDPLLTRIVKNPWFEAVSGTAILINTLILAFEIEYYGFDSGQTVRYKQYMSSRDTWPGLEFWFDVLDYIFVVFFTVELVIRISASWKGCMWARDGWIWFDTFIVLASILSWFEFGSGSQGNLDPTLLRIARLARMLRALKMIRLVRVFDSLFLLIRSIQASVGALFWSFILLIAVEVAFGMVLSQLLRQYIQSPHHPREKRYEVFLLFGTFSRTMLTMFEITLGNWVPSCRILMNNVSEWFALFYILYCCCFIFAVIRVIQAVFIAETNRLVAADEQIALIRKQRDKESYLNKLRMMFDELDMDGDGRLSREEVQHMSEDALLKTMMGTLDINVHDLETLFDLLDDGDGQIDIHEFVKGLARVKGGAQSIDVVMILKLMRNLESKADNIISRLQFEWRGVTVI